MQYNKNAMYLSAIDKPLFLHKSNEINISNQKTRVKSLIFYNTVDSATVYLYLMFLLNIQTIAENKCHYFFLKQPEENQTKVIMYSNTSAFNYLNCSYKHSTHKCKLHLLLHRSGVIDCSNFFKVIKKTRLGLLICYSKQTNNFGETFLYFSQN